MKRWLLAAVLCLGAVSCAEEPDDLDAEGPSDDDKLGELSFELTGRDSQGRQYRLRNAEFAVSSTYYGPYPYDGFDPGYPYPPPFLQPSYGDGGAGFSTRVSTETDPDAEAITLRLVPGDYVVGLEGDWYVERITPKGPERVEQVVLLDEPYQYTSVYHQSQTYLPFRFGIDGTLIDFRHGELQIGAEFELPGDSDYDAGAYPVPPYFQDASVIFPK